MAQPKVLTDLKDLQKNKANKTHTHDYLPLSGGKVTGTTHFEKVGVNNNLYVKVNNEDTDVGIMLNDLNTTTMKINHYGNDLFGNDLNNWKKGGSWMCSSSTTNVPIGDGWGTVLIYGNGDRINQIYNSWNYSPHIKYERNFNAGTWSQWTKTHDGGNADTVDGLHGYQLGTFASNGNSHGTGFPLMCQHNRDSDGMFKLYVEGHTTKVDFANNAHSVDGVHFHPRNDRPIYSNDTPYFYAFNGGDDENCYVKHTSGITVGNANKLGGYTLEQIKRMCGGDYVGKTVVVLGEQTLSNNKTFTYSNSKGGLLRVSFWYARDPITIVVDGRTIVSRKMVTDFANIMSTDESGYQSYKHEIMIPFDNTVSITNHDHSGSSIIPIAYVNK